MYRPLCFVLLFDDLFLNDLVQLAVNLLIQNGLAFHQPAVKINGLVLWGVVGLCQRIDLNGLGKISRLLIS